MFRHQQIWTAIDRLADMNGLSPSGLARKAGLDATAFNKSKRFGKDGRERWPSTESLSKILNVTKTDFLEFGAILKPDGLPDHRMNDRYTNTSTSSTSIPPYSGFFETGTTKAKQQDLVSLPEGQFDGDIAFRISDNSMLPVYRENDIVVISRKMKPNPGDRVVIKMADGEIKARVFLRQGNDTMTVMTFNSNVPEETINQRMVEWTGKITWASQ